MMSDFNSVKEKLKDDIFSEGIFEIIIENNIVEQTNAIVLNNGVIVGQNLEVLEMAIWGVDGVENSQILFTHQSDKFPCFFDENVNALVSVIPGVRLSEAFESSITEIMNTIEDEEELMSFGITQNEWKKYLDAKPKSVFKNKYLK